MAATRRRPSMQIFQDPVPSSDHHGVASYEAEFLSAFPVTDVSSGHHTLLEPPNSSENAPSPRKTNRVSSSPPPSVLVEKGLSNINIPPPAELPHATDSLVKKPQRMSPKQSKAVSGQPPFYSSFATGRYDKENMHSSLPPMYQTKANTELPQKPSAKRALGDAAPLRDRSNKKQKVKEEPEIGPVPEPHEMPPVEDDGTKPPYSYANLIGMAILRAPSRRLTLAQIYKWISESYSYYRNQETGWQNSIRHNLSLSKAFEKQERPKDDPGKGHYWVIVPGCEKQFHKARAARRMSKSESIMHSISSDISHQNPMSSLPAPPSSIVRSMDSSKFPDETELSSDATIPCSDPAVHDGQEPGRSMPPPSRQIPSSPPPADIHSSPPPPISRSAREDTPPRVPRLPSNSRSGGRKRKFGGLGDSGYYSSIESSATKGKPVGQLLTSEADMEKPSIKRGRAEEEIARIRGSSYDSPSKTRPYLKPSNTRHIPSSPLRALDAPVNPLTPAIVFKRPALPPASASPNTNLRNHRNRIRELVGSPDKTMAVMVDNQLMYQPWSPASAFQDADAFNLHEPGFDHSFDVFADLESPTKRSAKRPRLERAATTTGILADITGFKSNSKQNTPHAPFQLKSPFLDMPNLESPARLGSPIKGPTSNPLPAFTLSKPADNSVTMALAAQLHPDDFALLPQDENLLLALHSDESEEAGFDILQGFQKIGAAVVAPNGSPAKAPSRPGLTRSSTTRF